MKKLNNLKWFSLGVAVCLLVSVLFVPAFASSLTKSADLVYNNINISLNGTAITPTDASGNTVEPFTIDGTTYLPVRAIANALGLGVSWDGSTNTVALTSSASGSSSSTGSTSSSSASGTLGNYAVTIKGISVTTDYQSNPAVIVTYSWTNNSSNTLSFASALYAKAFQNGIQLGTAFISSSNSNYDSSGYIKEIKPGASLDVQIAYSLRDSKNSIDVEVTQLLSTDKTVVTKTFSIA